MQSKLTLRLDAKLIHKAKAFAAKRGTSLAGLIADFFNSLGDEPTSTDLPPITKSLRGMLKGKPVEESDYRRYLEKKHL